MRGRTLPTVDANRAPYCWNGPSQPCANRGVCSSFSSAVLHTLDCETTQVAGPADAGLVSSNVVIKSTTTLLAAYTRPFPFPCLHLLDGEMGRAGIACWIFFSAFPRVFPAAFASVIFFQRCRENELSWSCSSCRFWRRRDTTFIPSSEYTQGDPYFSRGISPQPN